jgi:hypothetical protein
VAHMMEHHYTALLLTVLFFLLSLLPSRPTASMGGLCTETLHDPISIFFQWLLVALSSSFRPSHDGIGAFCSKLSFVSIQLVASPRLASALLTMITEIQNVFGCLVLPTSDF